MAITPFKTFAAGEVLTASDLNSSITTITNVALTTPMTAALDMDGFELILDADADTSITSDTGNRIDFRIAGTDSVVVGPATSVVDGFLLIDPIAFSMTANAPAGKVWIGNTRAMTIPAGTASVAASLYIEEPNLTATGTVTDAATLYISGAPTEGTANYAALIAGATRVNGTLTGGSNATITGALTCSSTIAANGDVTFTGAELIYAARADVASGTSGTTDVYGSTTNYVRITGTNTITSLGTAASSGEWRHIVFGGALTFTHNATSLILPGAANITTAAGDTAIVISEGSGNSRVVSYIRASGQSVIAASNAFGTVAVSGQSDVVADAAGDTLTLAAGTNITITTVAGTDTITIAGASSGFTQGTEQATTSGSSVTFGSIPAGTDMIVVNIEGVSKTAGSTTLEITLGDAGGLETAGYSGTTLTTKVSAGVPTVTVSVLSASFVLNGAIVAAADLVSGQVILSLKDAANFTWTISGGVSIHATGDMDQGVVYGVKSLSAELTQISVLTGGTFDAGSVNIMYL